MKSKRLAALFLTIVLLLLGVDARIFSISQKDSGIKAANTHGSYSLKINTGRGTIYDRNHQPLVNMGVKYVAAVAPQTDAASQLSALAPHVKDMRTLESGFQKGLPFTVTVDTPDINVAGVSVVRAMVRYSNDSIAPHIIGYVNSDGNGVTGIEKAFDSELNGYSGSVTETYAVDAKRRVLAGAQVKTACTGDTSGGIVLTLDSSIQKAAKTAAEKYLKSGSVIVMDIKSGDILACVSEPSFLPGNVGAALKGSDSPFLNRVFESYNLGSAFKIAVASAALDSGIDKSFSYRCTGAVNVAGRNFHCEKLAGHGDEDMSQGFANSCNTYFITLGLKTGGEKILDMAKRFGFGVGTKFAPGMSSDDGVLPSEDELSSPAAVANFSMGQGELMVTPVQVACMVSAVANGGMMPAARLVEGIYDGTKMKTEYPGKAPVSVISGPIASEVSGFMINTVNEGTGMPAKPVYGGAGGKTATAETGWLKNGKIINQAWFAGFYPAESPKYAIVAMCENGKAGGSDAGPVFKYIADSLSSSCGFPAVAQ